MYPNALPPMVLVSASVGCFQGVPGILGPVNRHEELLHVPIHPALAHLISLDFDEGVMPALRAHAKTRRSQRARESPRSRFRLRLRETDAREEVVGRGEHLRRRSMTAIEVPHCRMSFGRSEALGRRRRLAFVQDVLHPF